MHARDFPAVQRERHACERSRIKLSRERAVKMRHTDSRNLSLRRRRLDAVAAHRNDGESAGKSLSRSASQPYRRTKNKSNCKCIGLRGQIAKFPGEIGRKPGSIIDQEIPRRVHARLPWLRGEFRGSIAMETSIPSSFRAHSLLPGLLYVMRDSSRSAAPIRRGIPWTVLFRRSTP